MPRIQIRQRYNRQSVIHVPRNVRRKPLPGPAVPDHPVPINVLDSPSESVVRLVRLAIVELLHGPHPVQARFFQQFIRVQRRIPLLQILHGEIQRAVRSGIQ